VQATPGGTRDRALSERREPDASAEDQEEIAWQLGARA